jgi:alpha-galactosidase
MPAELWGRGAVLVGRHSSLVLAVDEDGVALQTHYGARLPDAALRELTAPRTPQPPFSPWDRPAFYPVYGGPAFGEVCLAVTYGDGVRDVRLQVEHLRARGEELHLRLWDPTYGLKVQCVLRMEPDLDVVERQVTLISHARRRLEVEVARTACLVLPDRPSYRLTHLVGTWGHETQRREETLREGTKVLESRRGLTSHQHNPFFALDDGLAQEEEGEVYFGLLAYSGNWEVVYEHAPFGLIRVLWGLGSWDARWRLDPGERLVLPPAVHGYTGQGFGAMSRALHRFIRRDQDRRGLGGLRPVLYNGWEAVGFDVDEQGQRALADRAAQLGVELFVVDDGWFSTRDDDRQGLGDWTPNPKKFPRGLVPLAEHVHGRGMAFGLWVEPEMVNPGSQLYRAHPDWVQMYPTRPSTYVRHQLVLNLAREDVRAFLRDTLLSLLEKVPVDYLKWDMNRPFTESGWPTAPRGRAREIWYRHVQGLYALWEEIRRAHPGLLLEVCASGGGRLDLGALRRAHQVWTSDNTYPLDRLRIQEGFSLAYPARTMAAWVTDNEGMVTPLPFRFHVAMTGVLGLGGNLLRWSPEELDQARDLVARYKEIRPIVQEGRLYRLASPSRSPGGETALMYLDESGEEAVLFAFRTGASPLAGPWRVRLQGLDPQATYRVEGLPKPISGALLMGEGLPLTLTGPFASTVVRLWGPVLKGGTNLAKS